MKRREVHQSGGGKTSIKTPSKGFAWTSVLTFQVDGPEADRVQTQMFTEQQALCKCLFSPFSLSIALKAGGLIPNPQVRKPRNTACYAQGGAGVSALTPTPPQGCTPLWMVPHPPVECILLLVTSHLSKWVSKVLYPMLCV